MVRFAMVARLICLVAVAKLMMVAVVLMILPVVFVFVMIVVVTIVVPPTVPVSGDLLLSVQQLMVGTQSGLVYHCQLVLCPLMMV